MNHQNIHQATRELTRIAQYYLDRGLQDKASEVLDLVQRMERGLEEDNKASSDGHGNGGIDRKPN